MKTAYGLPDLPVQDANIPAIVTTLTAAPNTGKGQNHYRRVLPLSVKYLHQAMVTEGLVPAIEDVPTKGRRPTTSERSQPRTCRSQGGPVRPGHGRVRQPVEGPDRLGDPRPHHRRRRQHPPGDLPRQHGQGPRREQIEVAHKNMEEKLARLINTDVATAVRKLNEYLTLAITNNLLERIT
jgi:hypothetical protein